MNLSPAQNYVRLNKEGGLSNPQTRFIAHIMELKLY